ncbi:immunity protein YezG family protein [Pseudoalteromonas prydzensis]|jgi:acyl-ACP thioesterase|uniref:immunity protein YezG family protein n=1 Tax=Pseudoalteromonas prydzensis TaxID=182141 RepID=UPI0024BD51A9|nr:immunity protein YezG family protein [Pseudoalteromonas prydzensis]
MQPDIKNTPQQLGQYLYQQINEPWLEAQLILNCEDKGLLECQAHFKKADDSSEQPITVTDEIVDLFNNLFESATKHQPENWTRAIFTINRQGQFNLNFERDNNDDDVITAQQTY